MKTIEIKINADTGDKELYLFGDFKASWDHKVDDLKIIVVGV